MNVATLKPGDLVGVEYARDLEVHSKGIYLCKLIRIDHEDGCAEVLEVNTSRREDVLIRNIRDAKQATL